MKTWHNVEMSATDPDTNKLRTFCKENDVYYEASDCGYGHVHFEILCNKETANRIDSEVFGIW